MNGPRHVAPGLGGYPLAANALSMDAAEVQNLAALLASAHPANSHHVILDGTNERILHLLAARGRNTVRNTVPHVAQRVGESEANVRARMAVLERWGVVAGYEARIDWALVGLPLLALFEAECQPERSQDARDLLRQLPNLVDAVVTQDPALAPSSVVALVRAGDLEEVNTAIGRLSSAGLANLRTRVALERSVTQRHPIHSLRTYITVMRALPQFPAWT